MTLNRNGAARSDGRARLLTAARTELIEHGLAGVSLRGIARRADVSPAAPKYHFEDRAGLLTAVATKGFVELADALRDAVTDDGHLSLQSLGRAYVAFGLEHPALFDLMFRPDELHPNDPDLRAAEVNAIGLLSSAVPAVPSAGPVHGPPPMALVSWAFAHGLVTLTREGALQNISADDDPQLLLERLITAFDDAVS